MAEIIEFAEHASRCAEQRPALERASDDDWAPQALIVAHQYAQALLRENEVLRRRLSREESS